MSSNVAVTSQTHCELSNGIWILAPGASGWDFSTSVQLFCPTGEIEAVSMLQQESFCKVNSPSALAIPGPKNTLAISAISPTKTETRSIWFDLRGILKPSARGAAV